MLRTKHETYAAAERMIGTLGDRWSEFLPPSAFRRALRKPQPAERDYLAAYVRCWAQMLSHVCAEMQDPASQYAKRLPCVLVWLRLGCAIRLS